ncbi:unnamed protein product [Caretta caretta]
MASLLEENLFETRAQAPAPSKDFYQLIVTQKEVGERRKEVLPVASASAPIPLPAAHRAVAAPARTQMRQLNGLSGQPAAWGWSTDLSPVGNPEGGLAKAVD